MRPFTKARPVSNQANAFSTRIMSLQLLAMKESSVHPRAAETKKKIIENVKNDRPFIV